MFDACPARSPSGRWTLLPRSRIRLPVQTDSPTNQLMPDEGLHKITSPIVGTFYRSPGPEKEPYVKEGSKVSPESIVCIVEAMKLMNEIQAEISGEVVRSMSRTASLSNLARRCSE